jgi:hypothetical protein
LQYSLSQTRKAYCYGADCFQHGLCNHDGGEGAVAPPPFHAGHQPAVSAFRYIHKRILLMVERCSRLWSAAARHCSHWPFPQQGYRVPMYCESKASDFDIARLSKTEVCKLLTQARINL